MKRWFHENHRPETAEGIRLAEVAMLFADRTSEENRSGGLSPLGHAVRTDVRHEDARGDPVAQPTSHATSHDRHPLCGRGLASIDFSFRR